MTNFKILHYVAFLCFIVLMECIATSSSSFSGKKLGRDQINKLGYAIFVKHKNSFLNVTAALRGFVKKPGECALICVKHSQGFSFNFAVNPDEYGRHACGILSTDKYKDSSKFLTGKSGQSHYSIKSPCESQPCCNGATCIALYDKNSYVCECSYGFSGVHCDMVVPTTSPLATQSTKTTALTTTASSKVTPTTVQVWTLIARFSNSDSKNWMQSSGYWWYDKDTAQGDISNTTANEDMIAPAFWASTGKEIKISRTDDSDHTPLLVTTSNCLGGMTLRQKMSSYGDFRDGKVWSPDKCLGICDVSYSGNYISTAGFSQANCDGRVLKRNQIGFWCDFGWAGAVISIGGVSKACKRADHGLGVTEQNKGKLGTKLGCDFGDGGGEDCKSHPYALNVWIK